MFETLPSGPFDAVTCLNTSFGYGSNEENQQLIPTIARELRAGGALLLDVIVADEAESFGCWEDDLDGGLLTVENSWDADRHCMISHPSWSSETTQFVAPSPEYVRLYSMHEIEEMLDDAGLRHRRLPRGPGRTARNEHGPNHPATWVARRR